MFLFDIAARRAFSLDCSVVRWERRVSLPGDDQCVQKAKIAGQPTGLLLYQQEQNQQVLAVRTWELIWGHPIVLFPWCSWRQSYWVLVRKQETYHRIAHDFQSSAFFWCYHKKGLYHALYNIFVVYIKIFLVVTHFIIFGITTIFKLICCLCGSACCNSMLFYLSCQCCYYSR